MPVKVKEHPILVAIIGAAAVIIAAFITYEGATGGFSNGTFDYTGDVLSKTGAPISGAMVSIAEDQKVPQHIRTDSEGVFHAMLSKKTQHIHLDVRAEGYTAYNLDVPLRRTGSEEILLTPDTTKESVIPGSQTQKDHGKSSTGESSLPSGAGVNVTKQNVSDQMEQAGDRAAKAAIAEEIRISQPDYSPIWTKTESPATPINRISQDWAEARRDWRRALGQSAGPERVSRLKEKLEQNAHLTCSDQTTENVFCLPNGTDTDVVETAGKRQSTNIRH
jgi:hypothetical protein